jgi:hypothetical protein
VTTATSIGWRSVLLRFLAQHNLNAQLLSTTERGSA